MEEILPKILPDVNEADDSKREPSIVRLLTPEGMDALEKELRVSKGNAAVIVHPFFHDGDDLFLSLPKDDPEQRSYQQYLKRLQAMVERYSNLQLPLLLLEAEDALSNLPDTLTRMGIKEDTIFVVPTHISSAEPVDIDLLSLGHKLKTSGLRRASVFGSYLYLWSRYPTYPRRAATDMLQGCVGYTVKKLLDAGINATSGFASFGNVITQSR